MYALRLGERAYLRTTSPLYWTADVKAARLFGSITEVLEAMFELGRNYNIGMGPRAHPVNIVRMKQKTQYVDEGVVE